LSKCKNIKGLNLKLKLIMFLTSKDWVDSLEELLLQDLVFFNVTLIDDPAEPDEVDVLACVFCSSSKNKIKNNIHYI